MFAGDDPKHPKPDADEVRRQVQRAVKRLRRELPKVMRDRLDENCDSPEPELWAKPGFHDADPKKR
jgi:hypothetical protein